MASRNRDEVQPDLGVYVHVPFCERICPYCDFAVVAARPLAAERERRYVETLLEELSQRGAEFAGRRLESLYLGGGTPSLLTPASVARLADRVREAFAPQGPIEFTLEVNPSTLERERLPGFRGAGVNRVSVGVQSFRDPILHRLGRAHRGEAAHRTLEACRDVGFEQLSLDLMVAAPGQTRDDVAQDLEAALAYAPDHVSVYELTVEPGTPFATAAARGQLATPDEETALAMLEDVEARLAAAGLARYEISNYARVGCQARHNRRYWERRPVLGLGVGAFSTDPPSAAAPFGVRRSNPRSLEAYRARIASGAPPCREVLDAATARGEAIFLALRTLEGLDSAAFAREFGAPPRRFYPDAITEFVSAGLLEERDSGDLRLSARGRALSDSVFERFV